MAPVSASPLNTLPSLRWRGVRAEQQGIDALIALGLAVPALAWVDYDAPVVIYGRRGGVTAERAARAAECRCALEARRTGGGAVMAGPWILGFHLWLPREHPAARLSAVQSMVAFGARVAQVLADAGVTARMADSGDMSRVNAYVTTAGLDWNCYAGLSHGELLDRLGRKCLGLAQARTRTGVLVSAGLLTGPTPWETLDYVHLGRATRPAPARDLVSAGVDLSNDPTRETFEQRIRARLWTWLSTLESAPEGARLPAATMEA